MKIKLLLLVSVLFFAGCEDSETGPNCSLVICDYFRISINIKYVDKNTNAALLGAGNAAYKLADLKVTRLNYPDHSFVTNISETDNSVIEINEVVDGDLLNLGNLPADKLTISTKASESECCSVAITSLKINDVTICAPCTDLGERVIIKK